MHKKEIFKAYDIRGEYGKDFDSEFAKDLGRVCVEYFKAKKVVIARDARETSTGIAKETISGAVSAGAEVVDIGVCSTPLFYFSVIKEKANCGIMITASHLGEEFNGFKITGEKAVAIGGEEFLQKAESLFGVKREEKKGEAESKSFLNEYIEESIKLAQIKTGDIKIPMKISGNEIIINEIGAIVEKLNLNLVKSGEEVLFEFDPDGDRIMVINKNGRKVRGDLIGGLLAGEYFEGKKVVYDLRYSRGVLEYLSRKKITALPSRVGHALIKAVMRKENADFCGEQSGHMYFKEAGSVESSMLAMLLVLKTLQGSGKSVDELVKEVSSWHTTEEINFELDSREKIKEILENIKNKFKDGKIDETDGVKIEYPNWGFLLRASNTEPKLRLIVDAREEGLMREKEEEIVSWLQNK